MWRWGTLWQWIVALLAVGASLALGCDLEPCLADGEGCEGRATLALGPCAGSLGPVGLAELLANPPVAPAAVVVAGPLRRESAMCSQLGCATADGCCNGCGAALLLSADVTPGLATPADLRLHGSVDGVGLSCGGDESLVCCPVPTDGRQVVVTGELVEDGVSVDGSLYGLMVSALCLPE